MKTSITFISIAFLLILSGACDTELRFSNKDDVLKYIKCEDNGLIKCSDKEETICIYYWPDFLNSATASSESVKNQLVFRIEIKSEALISNPILSYPEIKRELSANPNLIFELSDKNGRSVELVSHDLVPMYGLYPNDILLLTYPDSDDADKFFVKVHGHRIGLSYYVAEFNKRDIQKLNSLIIKSFSDEI